jgi:nicotinate-nucleotide pyrophosphorylase (carboxylating)
MSSGWRHPAPEGWYDLVWGAIAEDVGTGDLSSAALEPGATVEWSIEAQAKGVLCGVGIAVELLMPEGDDPQECDAVALLHDGDAVRSGDVVAEGTTDVNRLLSRERTLLNFLMVLSGVATMTKAFVDQVAGLGVEIVDTRKTVPFLRSLQKYAVRCGGGRNHRMGLYDGIMLKDNHIKAVGSIRDAVAKVRSIAGQMTLIEVECTTLEQVDEAVRAGADIVMLDNMDPFMMKDAVKKFGEQVKLEASGGITLETVKGVAKTGVHSISVGSLTHSAPALPFHLEIR